MGAFDQGNIGGGASHVEGDNVFEAAGAGAGRSADDASGGAGENGADGFAGGGGERGDAAAGLHDKDARAGVKARILIVFAALKALSPALGAASAVPQSLRKAGSC